MSVVDFYFDYNIETSQQQLMLPQFESSELNLICRDKFFMFKPQLEVFS